jgi:hypothetical protein
VAENYANKFKCGRKIVMVAEDWPNFSEISGREMVEENLKKSFLNLFSNMRAEKIEKLKKEWGRRNLMS